MRLFLSIFALLFAHCIPQDVTAQDSPGREKVGSRIDEDPCGGSTAVTFDGHTYALVGIGNQCWFKENLRSDNYRNGDGIPGNLADSQWTTTTSGAQTVYGEGTSYVSHGSSDEVANLAAYGRLYNWYAVNDARGLCPVGFHVPTDSDWTALENALGGLSEAGTALKSSATDSPPWDGSNTSRPCPVATDSTTVETSPVSATTATGGVPLPTDPSLGAATWALVIPMSTKTPATCGTAFLSVASGIDDPLTAFVPGWG